MAANRPPPGTPSTPIHTTCPNCKHDKAVVVAAHFRERHCFCPACEHAWNCDDSPTADTA
jgi:DNA-directed RNA polymerase subunit M/transcription elongation factor TFIIS